MKLYDFSNLAKTLTALGFPEVNESRFKIVRRDLSDEIKQNNVRFGDDGVYLKVGGVEHKGYMYLKTPQNFDLYGASKFHIMECQTIISQKERGWFDGRYFWHNSNVVTLYDKLGNVLWKEKPIELCGNCRAAARGLYTNTQGFFDLLDIKESQTVRREDLDMFGYTRDWRQVSSRTRTERGYKCEQCKVEIIQPKYYRYIQVHHLSGDKTDNRRENLQCLCCLCHANVDKRHHENFKRKGSLAEIKSFVKIYRQQLLDANNPYVVEFLQNNLL